jgi:hypothetical protein
MDSGSRINGGGSGYAAHLAHAGGVLYGKELGSVTLKRVGLFCFPIKHTLNTQQAAQHTHRDGPGRPPFWRTPKESRKGLGSVYVCVFEPCGCPLY